MQSQQRKMPRVKTRRAQINEKSGSIGHVFPKTPKVLLVGPAEEVDAGEAAGGQEQAPRAEVTLCPARCRRPARGGSSSRRNRCRASGTCGDPSYRRDSIASLILLQIIWNSVLRPASTASALGLLVPLVSEYHHQGRSYRETLETRDGHPWGGYCIFDDGPLAAALEGGQGGRQELAGGRDFALGLGELGVEQESGPVLSGGLPSSPGWPPRGR